MADDSDASDPGRAAHVGEDGRRIAFIDLEASGLNARSWPVEVGWAFVDGPAEAHLVAPHASWPADAWDPAAERLHRLSRAYLEAHGRSPALVCDRLNAALAGCAVYSDAPDWDAFWLYRLYAVGRRRQAFAIVSTARLLGPLMEGRERDVLAAAARAAPARHRAAADAIFLQTLYRLARAAAGL